MRYLVMYESLEEIKHKVVSRYRIKRVLKRLKAKGKRIFYIEEY